MSNFVTCQYPIYPDQPSKETISNYSAKWSLCLLLRDQTKSVKYLQLQLNSKNQDLAQNWPRGKDVTTLFKIIGKQSITAWIGRNGFAMSICDIIWHATCNIFEFLTETKNYLKNATLQRSLVFQMSMLERFKLINFAKNQCFEPTLKKDTLKVFFCFFTFLHFFMVKIKLQCSA